MSEANGAQPTTEKTYSQKDLEIERGHAQAEKDLRIEAEKRLKAFEGIDPEDYKKTKTELDKIRREAAIGDPKKLEEWQQQKEAEIRAQVQKDLEAAKSKVDALSKQNKELTVTDRVFAIAATQINGDTSEEVKEYIRRHGDLNEKGEIIFKGEDGKPLYASGSATALMTPEGFIEMLRTKKPSFFKAKDVGGVRQPGERVTLRGVTISTLKDLSRFSSAEQKEILAKMTQPEREALFKN